MKAILSSEGVSLAFILITVTGIALNVYFKWEVWKRKVVYPISDLVNDFIRPNLIREEAIQRRIESSSNTREIFVIVNHLEYELNNGLKYDQIMAANINRGVTYYYLLPRTLKDGWRELQDHLRRAGVSDPNLQTHLRAKFSDKRVTSLVMYGLAIYCGADVYDFRRKKSNVMAIQYSHDFWHSVLVDTWNDSDAGAKAVRSLVGLFHTYNPRFKCHHG